ncbi:glycosyltransferase family 2 protein [Flavobacterium eburneipallidum]|uniref:glycosyltransferase family 2 protein n=1 Tax=Flavobacterium eburneipallidum TaxID=3003263 RepID=UPI00248236A8|nr:glycosyltransferase family A protein [Flavobacterium eburneipallidum]
MLSILIPTYNYDIFPLVSELHKQCLGLEIPFEIIVIDDASTDFIVKNKKINNLQYVQYELLEDNIGRSKIRNLLARKANYNWFLFLDADTIPVYDNFIQNYISEIKKEEKVIFGGIEYEKKEPNPDQLLRWIYGRSREAIPAEKRKINPNESALTSNLLIQKNVFVANQFDESITNYGYEDLVFLSDLKKKGILVKHIHNPTFHLGLECSQQFLNKTKIALENLKSITQNTNLEHSESKILKVHALLNKLHLTLFVSFLFKKSERTLTNNLFSSKPSLLLFDLYKLGYYCSIKS